MSIKQKPAGVKAKRMDQVSDDSLITRIAKSRDQAAFRELYRRYEKHAFNLARHMTRDFSTAEEVVQEAMLRLWLSAKTYRPGKVRSWLLCIVAREALKKRKRKSDQESRLKKLESEKPIERKDAAPVDPFEGQEAADMVRECLKALPERSRDMIALYFGAGLSQEEIGKELSMPTRTVSHKVSEALKILKGSLAQRGWAVALPMISEKGLREVLSAGMDVPKGLAEAVLESISASESTGLSSVTPGPAGRGGSSVLAWSAMGIATLVLSVGAAWTVSRSLEKKVPQELVAPTPGNSPSGEANDYKLTWVFKDGIPKDMRPGLGDAMTPSYRVDRTRDDIPAALVPTRKVLDFRLPPQVIPKPFVITIKARLMSLEKWGVSLYFWENKRVFLGNRRWTKFLRRSVVKSAAERLEIFQMHFTGTHLIKSLSGSVYSIEKCTRIPISASIVVAAKTWRFESFEIQSTALSEMDPKFLDPQGLIDANQLKEATPEQPFGPGNGDIEWVE